MSKHLPEAASKVQLPDINAVIDFFVCRNDNDDKSIDNSRLKPELIVRPLDIHAHLKE